MMKSNLKTADVQLLVGLADILLHAGRDRAADAIYAAVEADAMTSIVSCVADWDEVFAG